MSEVIKNNDSIFIAHKNDDGEIQELKEHLFNTATKAFEFADIFDLGECSKTVALLHDVGKYSKEFQQKINGKNISVDHSTAGAKLLYDRFGEIGKLLGMVIAGHHTGLQDFGNKASVADSTYLNRLKNNIYDYSVFVNEIDEKNIFINAEQLSRKIINSKEKHDESCIGFVWSMLIKMLYSCTVDADFLDTERFFKGEIRNNKFDDIETLLGKFDKHIATFVNSKKATSNQKIYEKRNEILQSCMNAAESDINLFTLMVPTGAGKTLSSMAFALNHAKRNNLNRIIYVIPYISIIEQTAKIFKSIFGEENVLEHHSNFYIDDIDNKVVDNEVVSSKQSLASENWDVPIIITTNVQFFESCFGNKSSKLRKLHNIANSVVIFDEVQQLPFEYIRPCMNLLSELVSNYNTSIVMCSATCPDYEEYLYKQTAINSVNVIKNFNEIYKTFEKVKLKFLGEVTDEELAEKLSSSFSALCVVNTRKHARKLYELVGKGDGIYHLSTLMTPFDRKNTIAEIKQRLNNEQKCVVISTQLIEAGVDLDFEMVYRSMAGIDSIVQAAGRCNREGHLEFGQVCVFEPLSESAKISGQLKKNAVHAREVIRQYHEDSLSLDAVKHYFNLVFKLKDKAFELDKKKILENFIVNSKQLKMDFKTAAYDFKFIENENISIIVNINEESDSLISLIKEEKFTSGTNRKLQQYSVSVFEHEFKKLHSHKSLEVVNKYIILLDNKLYDKKTGLDIYSDENSDAIIL